jgi:G3E family GTPase
VVIELSGVADPAAVRYNLAQGGVATSRVVTLVDANAFPSLYHSWVQRVFRTCPALFLSALSGIFLTVQLL